MYSISLSKIICTGFGSGLAKKAPGTFGSLAFLILWYAIFNFGVSPSVTSKMLIFTITALAGHFATIAYLKSIAHYSGSHSEDPQEVVIDEWAGLGLALLFSNPSNPLALIVCFTLFRAFDITKPWPIRKLETLPGAWGVMLDDLLAGLYTLIITVILNAYEIL